jgi:hypothetical protein
MLSNLIFITLFGLNTKQVISQQQEFIEPKIDILNNPDKETASSDK